jgi:methylmalonyl-CoA epimerase
MIRDVHHVGIAVRDLDAALRFYSDALSLPVVKRGDAPSRGARVAMVAVGGSYLELVQPTADGSPFASFIEERGEGLHHVAFATDDVDALVASLRGKGVPLTDETPREGFTGRLSYLAPEAFDGAQLEVVQPSPELSGGAAADGPVTRVDHVVLRLPFLESACERLRDWLGVETKRTFERGDLRFSFARPGDVVVEMIGPKLRPSEPRAGFVAGLAFECVGIDALAAALKAKGLPVGEPHPALQGGRIVSVHASGPGVAGVPVAFIDFTDAPVRS